MALMEAASAQIANHYNLPGALLSGVTDAKFSDVQSGWEKGFGATTIALAGGQSDRHRGGRSCVEHGHLGGEPGHRQ